MLGGTQSNGGRQMSLEPSLLRRLSGAQNRGAAGGGAGAGVGSTRKPSWKGLTQV